MDATLLTILLLLVAATVLALVQARRRDACLKSFDGYYVSLAEQGGDLTWGTVRIFSTGLEIRYAAPVRTRKGHVERSFIFYKDQYEAMDALYRYPEGLDEAAQAARRRVIEQTVWPSLSRRIRRRIRNWISMVRDALLQAVSLVVGAAKTRAPGTAVLSSQEAQIKSLSSEIIGHAGNAYDPLLEQHLFSQVVVELTREGQATSYCGWLKEYTSGFVEVVDAYANDARYDLPLRPFALDDALPDGVEMRVEAQRLYVRNAGAAVLHVHEVAAADWRRPVGCVLPPGYTADLTLPAEVDPASMQVMLGSVERFDLVVPRARALIRHAADGSEAIVPTLRPGVVAQAVGAPGASPPPGDASPPERVAASLPSTASSSP